MGRESFVGRGARVRRVVVAAIALLAVAGGARGGAARAGDDPAPVVVATADLLASGAVWDPPEFALDVELLADGTLGFLRTPCGLDEFEAFLADLVREPKTRRKDGASYLDAVLRVHPTAPWTLVQWVMTSLARARIHRISFAVRPLVGGDEGVLPAFLPLDPGVLTASKSWRDAALAPTKLTVVAAAREDDEGAVLAALVEATKARAPHAAVLIETPTLPAPSAGAVLRVLDLVYRAGASAVAFTGMPAPVPKGDRAARSLEGLRAFTAAWRRDAGAGASVTVAGKAVGPAVAGPRPPLPARVLRIAPTDDRQASGGAWFDADAPDAAPPAARDANPVEDAVGGGPPAPLRAPDRAPPEAGPGDGAPPAPAPAPDAGERASRPGTGVARDEKVAVADALAWLAAHQASDGHWSPDAATRWCDGVEKHAAAEEEGAPQYEVGLTALATLAFLGAGHSSRSEGPYGPVVERALAWLREAQDFEGCYPTRNSGHYVYGHALATWAMVEGYRAARSTVLKASAQHALDFVAVARTPHGAWRYGIQPGDADTSVTGLMGVVLAAAAEVNAADASARAPASFVLDAEAFEGLRRWIEKMTDPETGRVGYTERGSGSARAPGREQRFPSELVETMTAMGVLARHAAGDDPAKGVLAKGLALLAATPPRWDPAAGTIDYVWWWFGAMAMARAGGAKADAWRTALVEALVPHQRTDGDVCGPRGSWDPLDAWGPDGGRVYATATAVLALQARARVAPR